MKEEHVHAKITEEILNALVKGLCATLMMLDISKAFDTLDIDPLYTKLSYYL